MRQTRLLMVVAVACVTIAAGMSINTHIVRGQATSMAARTSTSG